MLVCLGTAVGGIDVCHCWCRGWCMWRVWGQFFYINEEPVIGSQMFGSLNILSLGSRIVLPFLWGHIRSVCALSTTFETLGLFPSTVL